MKYSKKRFSALCHEWFTDYPCLDSYVLPLKNKKNGFKHSDITDSDLDDVALALSVMDQHKSDPIKIIAEKMFESHGPSKAIFRNSIFKILYSVGILGVKKACYTSVSWSHCDDKNITESEIKNSTHFEIHPMLHSYLGVNSNKHQKHQGRVESR